ncbi:MAG: methyltransferase family protein [Myxococcota bacterium]
MHTTEPAYGLWWLVAINSFVFIAFAFSFTRPRSARDWRSLGAFAAFVVALFAEMYGFPLTVYLLSGWLGSRVPGLTLDHDAGHLWHALSGWEGDPHLNPIHLFANALILGGVWLLSSAWAVLHRAQREHRLAVEGPYALVRHPQYVAFVLVMLGFLVMWPTLPTLVMFPILVAIYVRLARREEADVRRELGEVYDAYARVVPAFIPRFRPSQPRSA